MPLGLDTSVKSVIKRVCHTAGVNALVLRARRSDLLVLCYHGVVRAPRPERWSYENCVDAGSFRAQLRWLRRFRTPIRLDALPHWYQGQLPIGKKGAVIITFDDGYRNNLTVAAPILKAEGFPAVVFLSTSYIGTRRVLWNDELRVRVLAWPQRKIRLPTGALSSLPADQAGRRALAEQINSTCKRLPASECAGYLEYLAGHTESVEPQDDPEAREFMSWDDARQLAAMGFQLGSHTVSHPILSRVDPPELERELRESKQVIERETGAACNALAYPNGTAADVNPEVFRQVREAGYQWAFTTAPRWHLPSGDPHRIARICVPGHTDLATFQFWTSGLHARLTGTS